MRQTISHMCILWYQLSYQRRNFTATSVLMASICGSKNEAICQDCFLYDMQLVKAAVSLATPPATYNTHAESACQLPRRGGMAACRSHTARKERGRRTPAMMLVIFIMVSALATVSPMPMDMPCCSSQ